MMGHSKLYCSLNLEGRLHSIMDPGFGK